MVYGRLLQKPRQRFCVYDLTSADVCPEIGCTTAEKWKSIMWVQKTVAVVHT